MTRKNTFLPVLLLALTLGIIALVTVLGPTEKTLGANLHIVILHGAWVWTGLAVIGAAALAGFLGLLLHKRTDLAGWSLALGRTGLMFWLIYLPMSLLVMQLNWGGFFLAEPRWKISFSFVVVGVLLQVGLSLLHSPRLTCASNLVFAVALAWNLMVAQNILHPASPVASSNSGTIQLFFIILLGLCLLLSGQVAWLFNRLKR